MPRIVRITRWPLIAVIIVVAGLLSYRIAIVEDEAQAAILPMMFLSAPSQADVMIALHRAGLDAESLAASGADSEEAGEVAADVMAYVLANPAALQTADTAYGSARSNHDQLARIVRSGMATEQQIEELATARTTLATTEAARDAAVDAVFAAGTADLEQPQVTLLQMLRSNRDHWRNLPVEFLTVEHAENDWLALRNALAEERIVASGGFGSGPDGELSAASQSLLASERTNGTVATAITNLSTNLALIESAMDSASTPQ